MTLRAMRTRHYHESVRTAHTRASRRQATAGRTLLVLLCLLMAANVPGESTRGDAAPDTAFDSGLSQPEPPYSEALLPASTLAGVVRGPGGTLYGVTYEGGDNNLGTIFAASADLSSVMVLHHFGGADGARPYAELTLDGSDIYGTTQNGGVGGGGTVFKFSSGVLTTLASFGFGGPNAPGGPLLLLNGYLYGSTTSFPGGSTIFRVPINGGDLETLYPFRTIEDASAPDGFAAPDGYAPGALTFAADGFLYGTALYGGDPTCYPAPYRGCGTIFRLRPEPDANGSVEFDVLYTFRPPPPPPDEEQAPEPPVTFPQRKLVVADGRLYGTTFAVVFSLPLDGGAPDGSDLVTLHRIPKFSSIFTPPIEGVDGRLYVTEYFGGSLDAGTVFSLQKDGTNLVVHHEFSYDDERGQGPYGVLFQDSAGTIFGTTEYNGGATPLRGVVFAIRGGNLAPIAVATAPATATAGGNPCLASVVLDGTGASDPNLDVLTYSWKEGATEIATGSLPTVQLGPGSHTITLTVRDPSGATDSDTVTVIVTGNLTLDSPAPALLQGGVDNPVSARLLDTGVPVAGAVVTFTVGGVAYPATTDAGGIATAAVPIPAGAVIAVIQIDSAGGACGDATLTHTVPVNRWPVASGTASSPNVAGPSCSASVTLDASASFDADLDPLTYLWQEGVTTLSTMKTPVVSLAGGVHQITLTVSDGRGGSNSTVVNAEVLGEVSTLAYTGPAQMPSGVSTIVSALLKTDGGLAIAGATVRFSLDGSASSAVTDAAGIASTSVTGTTVGNRELRIDYFGDACHQGKVAFAPVEVLPQTATLRVIKTVINDNGGGKQPADFTINVSGIAPVPAQFPGDAAGTTVTLNAGAYSVTEINLAGYDASSSPDCFGVIALGETKTCTITNDDRPATLKLSKVVVNDSGGNALASSWTLNGNGQPFTQGVAVEVAPGDYTLTETGGLAGYTASPWQCTGGALNGNVVTVAANLTVECLIVNDDQPATLTLTKTVINDNGGGAPFGAWLLTANGSPFVSGVSAVVNAGSYTLAESGGPSGYTPGPWVCVGGQQAGASVVLGLGEVVSCSITNDDQPASLTLTKIVINDSGGVAEVDDWVLTANGTRFTSGLSAPVNAGTYVLAESGPAGYTASGWVCIGGQQAGASIVLAPGDVASCSITNNDVAPPTPPVANAQSIQTPEDTPAGITLTATDANGDVLAFEIVTGPSNGVLSGAVPNVTYNPNPDYSGPDSFTFQANDGGLPSNIATVSIIVTPVNDAPVAADQVVTTLEDTPNAITLTATDIDGPALTFAVLSGPSNGTIVQAGSTVTYTPAPDYSGPDSFTFVANDGALASNVATVSVTVTPVNDAPVVLDHAVTTLEDTPKAITLMATDIDGPTLAFAILSGPSNGSLVLAGSTVTYTPAPNYFGPDSFTFTANDGTLDSNLGTVAITVTPVNDAPVAADDAATTASRTAVIIAVLSNDQDVENDPLVVTVAGPASNGTVTRNADGTVTYLPRNNFRGPDSFEYAIDDGQGGTAIGTVRVVVGSANAPPRAVRDNATTVMGVPVVIAVLFNDTDPDADALTIIALSTPGDGVVVNNGDGTVTYTPAPGFRGQDRFTYTVSDGRGGTDVGDVQVRVR